MQGIIHHGPPPGTCTATQAAKRLNMSRQNFQQSGLSGALERWQVGPGNGTLLYLAEDIDKLARWLEVRQGLVALGIRPANEALNPSDGDFYNAVEEGYWDTSCPICIMDAIGEPEGQQVWCPVHGVQEIGIK